MESSFYGPSDSVPMIRFVSTSLAAFYFSTVAICYSSSISVDFWNHPFGGTFFISHGLRVFLLFLI